MFMLRLRSLVREEVSASRRELMALSNSQLALAVRVPRRDRQVTALAEAMVSDFTVAMPRNGLPGPERKNGRLSALAMENRDDCRWRAGRDQDSQDRIGILVGQISGDQATPRVPYLAPLPPRHRGRRHPVRFECALTRRSYVVRYSRNSCVALLAASRLPPTRHWIPDSTSLYRRRLRS